MVKKRSKKDKKKSLKEGLKKILKKSPKKSYQHRSFKRSYREDYRRELNVPKASAHIAQTFKVIFADYKLFLPLIAIMATIGSLIAGATKETMAVFAVLIFLVLWLTAIFLVRHKKAGRKVKLRDGFYNAMAPLIPTLVIFLVAVIQCIPIFLLVIAYSSAVQTEFLATPFYALLFWGFAVLMILLSSYFLSGTLIALVAVTAPGLYPLVALMTASDLMVGRRVRFILRLVVLILLLAIIWAVIIAPLTLLNVPELALAIVVMVLACFSAVYSAVFLYIYYRSLIDEN